VPELPEVETVRRGLLSTVVGRRVERVEVGRERTVRRTSRQALVDGLTGVTILDVQRRGKYLLAPLDSGYWLMVHLRMSGRLLVAPTGSPRPAHTHVALSLGTEELWFVDPRTFGEVVVYDPENATDEMPELARLGVDPIVDPFDRSVLRSALAETSRAIKTVLLDQHRIAGLGNIYTDEVLHRARVRYDRPASALRPVEIDRLAVAISTVLADAIEAGGSTLDDTQYVDVEGRTGEFQHQHLVYGRQDEGCLTCGKSVIRRAVVGGRSTFFCPRCQK
jgi:formamidopyrimidine-DNA glycosylase